MAGSACDADTILVNASWNGTAFNIVTGVSYTVTVQDVAIRGEGVIGPSCRGPVFGDLVGTVTFLVNPPFDPIAHKRTAANLVFTVEQADGGQRVITMSNMIPRGVTYAFDRDTPAATYVQQFVHQGDMATLPITNP